MSANRFSGGDGARQKSGRRDQVMWQMDSSPLYLRRQDHLNDRLRGLHLNDPLPMPQYSTPTRAVRSPRSPENNNSSDYDNTPPEPPKRTSSSSMTPSCDSMSTSSSSFQYKNGGYGAGSSTRSNEGLYASPGTSGLVASESEEWVDF